MPRRNKTQPVKLTSLSKLAHTTQKTAYTSKQQAEQAIKETRRYTIDVELYTYQSPLDGKWYLSSRKDTNDKA